MSERYRMEAQELAAAEQQGPDRVPPEPRPSAGCILARPGVSGPEVLLVRRRDDVGFAAGAYVFPGGTLDEEDADPAWGERLEPGAIDFEVGSGEPPPRAFLVAALRETFEETGVLLARGRLQDRARIREDRRALVEGRRGFLEIVTSYGVRLAADRLVLCARWITPESLSRRYDARFFLAEAPETVSVVPELGELVEHVWITPERALESYFDDRFPMLFPTARTLSWLRGGAGVSDWMERFTNATVEPILPRLRRRDGEVIPVIPGEPGYDEREGDG